MDPCILFSIFIVNLSPPFSNFLLDQLTYSDDLVPPSCFQMFTYKIENMELPPCFICLMVCFMMRLFLILCSKVQIHQGFSFCQPALISCTNCCSTVNTLG